MDDKDKTREVLINELQDLRKRYALLQAAENDCQQSDTELTPAHAFQQSIIDGILDPIMVIDTDYRVLLMNRAARESSAIDTHLSEPYRCYEISHLLNAPCSGQEHPCPLEQVRNSLGPVQVVHRHYQADGTSRLLEINAAPYWGPGGNFQGIIESMRDITTRKQTEEALARSAERLRALAAQLSEVAEAERQRLARALHDLIGQNLTALGINLNIIQSQLPDEVYKAVQPRLNDSLLLVEETTDKIRHVMANLRPPVLDDYGLMAALHWYGEQVNERTESMVTVEGSEPNPRLPASVENTLFRIVQEALTNVVKHARAAHVTVRVDAEEKMVHLSVLDDGVGFDTSQFVEPEDGRGWGLLIITERAEAVGGRCHIESIPGKGTKVIVEVPR